MTQFEEYQGKNQQLGYLIQLLTYFITMNKSASDIANDVRIQKLQGKIRGLADKELKEELKVI